MNEIVELLTDAAYWNGEQLVINDKDKLSSAVAKAWGILNQMQAQAPLSENRRLTNNKK